MSAAPRLLLAPADVDARRAAARGPLAPLVASLSADHAVARDRALFVPAEKARMTRVGGRCAVDGALLAFDPYAPRRHVCPTCGRVYDDEAHYRWWIFWYQLWLAERAVHGAALALVGGDAPAGAFARDVLAAYAERYLTYPNRDNVLGPTRPFFSTYLESIWLLQLCVALDLLESGGHAGSLGGEVRDRIVQPSRALIAQYDERRSNRQVWNAAALAAAARVLGDDDAFERAVLGASGVLSHLEGGLLPDGTWYEGENYHQFAHRGLWYGVTLAVRGGISLSTELLDRFAEGFVAPFLTALPDLTLPARRDSQWAISLRQWRWAESCELGLARRDDVRLAGTLAALYDPDAPAPRRDTGRWRTAAESERNEPPSRLDRADLGWRSLLHARAVLPPAEPWAPDSVLLPAQGIAVFRRDRGTLWTAMDYGTSGGGHGHPDRLNVLLADHERRWLDDMGTGSYVERALHWYRSTLAHDAPLVNGASQPKTDGRLDAYDEHGDWGWVSASADVAPGVVARRALVVGRDYVIDRVTWRADADVALDLPLHVDANATFDGAWRDAEVHGAGGLEDGFDFLTEVRAADVHSCDVVRLHADSTRAIRAIPDAPSAADAPLRAWVASSAPSTWFEATAPSSPGRGTRRFHFVRVRGAGASITAVWDTRGAVADAVIGDGRVRVTRADGGVDEHTVADDMWRVRETRGDLSRVLVLDGRVAPAPSTVAASEGARVGTIRVPSGRAPLRIVLGEAHYRRSEQSWHEAGRPRATVSLSRVADALRVDVDVDTPHPTFVPAGRDNPLDNERAETNGDGVQLYVRPGAGDVLGWLLVPEEEVAGSVRVIPLSPAAARVRPTAHWSRTGDGYALTATVPRDALGETAPVAFDLVVNETTPDRERRRGQLVLSGARGEFVYLQGDRHDPDRMLQLRFDA